MTSINLKNIKWTLATTESFNVNRHYLPQLLKTSFNSHILKVSVISKDANQDWVYAGKLIQVVDDLEIGSRNIQLGKNLLVELTDVSVSYKLLFQLNHWIRSAVLTIYQGRQIK